MIWPSKPRLRRVEAADAEHWPAPTRTIRTSADDIDADHPVVVDRAGVARQRAVVRVDPASRLRVELPGVVRADDLLAVEVALVQRPGLMRTLVAVRTHLSVGVDEQYLVPGNLDALHLAFPQIVQWVGLDP